jgi:ribosomal protein S18 acetylase RimI-like enzyme
MSTAKDIHPLSGAPAPASRGDFEILSKISEADGCDLDILVRLLDPDARFDIAAVQSAIDDGTATVIIQRLNGHIVASAAIARFTTPTGTHHRIEDVIVDTKLRGQGTGRRLMEYMLEHLRQSGARSVELTSRPSRVAANALYRSLDFKPRETNVYEYRFKSQDEN